MSAKARIVIEIGGGLIQRIVSNGVEIDLAVVDYDADDVSPRDLIKCPGLDKGSELLETYAVKYDPEVDSESVDAVFDAIEREEPAFSEDELAKMGQPEPEQTG